MKTWVSSDTPVQSFVFKITPKKMYQHLSLSKISVGGFEIISGGVDGIVTSFHPHDSLWRCNIGEESARLDTGSGVSS
jgi:hypothetical protein